MTYIFTFICFLLLNYTEVYFSKLNISTNNKVCFVYILFLLVLNCDATFRNLLWVFICYIFTLMSLVDILFLEVPDFFHFLLILSLYIYFDYIYVSTFIIYLLFFNILYLLASQRIGGADIKLFIGLSLFFSLTTFPYLLATASFYGICYLRLNPLYSFNKPLPFIPFIQIAFFSLIILKSSIQ